MTQVMHDIRNIFEVWEVQGATLGLNSASYGQRHSMQLESESVHFEPGTGLPGKVWSARAPVLFDQFGVVDLIRAEAARSIGLSAGIGLPIIDGRKLTSVFTLLLGDREDSFVCEVWTPNREGSLRLRSGYYSRHFCCQGISSKFEFPFGQGLPGVIWSTRSPQIVEDLGAPPMLVGGEEATPGGWLKGNRTATEFATRKVPTESCLTLQHPAPTSYHPPTEWREWCDKLGCPT